METTLGPGILVLSVPAGASRTPGCASVPAWGLRCLSSRLRLRDSSRVGPQVPQLPIVAARQFPPGASGASVPD
jgi:hypothetical protein